MTNPPTYRYRGRVEPSAEAKRPVAVHRAPRALSGSPSDAPLVATIDIFDVIDSYGGWWGISASEVDAALKQLGAVDTLHVRLNSPGGQATEGVAIANVLRAHPATVRTTVYGIAASAASVIAIAADHVSMAPGSILMVHEASDITWGDAAEMRTAAAALDAVSDSYADLYALKAGGTRDEWRAVMVGEKWYPAADAVTAKLADQVGLDPQLPANLPAVEDDDSADEVVVVVDVEVNPAARAAARRFDLSMYAHAPAALAPTTPAAQPVTPSTEPKEADTMSDTLLAELRKQLGLADDADEATVLAANAEALSEAADPPPAPAAVDVKAVAAALEADGKVVVSKAKYDALNEQAELGAKAYARQISEDRDGLIEAAMSAGKINRSKASRESWEKEFARDFDTAKADLESLPARFPVGPVVGHLGGDDTAGAEPFTDDEAGTLAALVGVKKEALTA